MESTGNTAGWKENGEGKVRTVSLSDGKKVAWEKEWEEGMRLGDWAEKKVEGTGSLEEKRLSGMGTEQGGKEWEFSPPSYKQKLNATNIWVASICLGIWLFNLR